MLLVIIPLQVIIVNNPETELLSFRRYSQRCWKSGRGGSWVKTSMRSTATPTAKLLTSRVAALPRAIWSSSMKTTPATPAVTHPASAKLTENPCAPLHRRRTADWWSPTETGVRRAGLPEAACGSPSWCRRALPLMSAPPQRTRVWRRRSCLWKEMRPTSEEHYAPWANNTVSEGEMRKSHQNARAHWSRWSPLHKVAGSAVLTHTAANEFILSDAIKSRHPESVCVRACVCVYMCICEESLCAAATIVCKSLCCCESSLCRACSGAPSFAVLSWKRLILRPSHFACNWLNKMYVDARHGGKRKGTFERSAGAGATNSHHKAYVALRQHKRGQMLFFLKQIIICKLFWFHRLKLQFLL